MLIAFPLPTVSLRGSVSGSPTLNRLRGVDIRTPGGRDTEGKGAAVPMSIGMATLPGGMAVPGPTAVSPPAGWTQAERAALRVPFFRRSNPQRLRARTESRFERVRFWRHRA